ncbi:sugar transporter [Microthyrium microscopicum]|uniref:Sugar transporter n=1 Tax=Microthyrium microscopicum TaxID=703497 RepID=A0A6A6U907_9PEZI|nr:sugar transporter [Microthyrium microscopicum]
MAPSKTRVYNWYISLVAASCMVLYGYDASTFNAISGSDNWNAYFDDIIHKPNQYGAINTAYTVGAIVAGWFFGGPLADYAGRRAGMIAGALLVILATFMQAFAPRGNIGVFIGGRVIIGLGQGLALTAGPVYINELAPPEIRGVIMTFWQMFYSVGSFIAYWVNYACQIHKKSLGNWDWRMVIVFQLLVPILIVGLVFTIPETPRWYIQHGDQVEKARASLRRVRATEQEVEEELLEIQEAINFERTSVGSGYKALWTDKSVRKRLFIAFALNAGQQITGQGTLNTYSTIIYKKVFKSDQVSLINALNATFAIPFTLNAMWTADRFGRKFLFIVGAAGMAVCMLIVATVGIATPFYDLRGGIFIPTDDKVHGTKQRPVAIAIAFLLFLFSFFYKPSWGATTWIWTSEVFSMNVRAQATGMASQTQNIANSIVQQFFPTFLNNTGFACFYLFMAVNVLLAIFVWFVVPETKGVRLEEMDVLFGGANHVEQGAELVGVGKRESVEVGDGGKGLNGKDGVVESSNVVK